MSGRDLARRSRRLCLLVALALTLRLAARVDAEDAPTPSATPAPASDATGAGLLNGWTTTTSARVIGRGVGVHGDERKYREDYDDLGTGGGASGSSSAYDAAGHYLDLEGAFLEQ